MTDQPRDENGRFASNGGAGKRELVTAMARKLEEAVASNKEAAKADVTKAIDEVDKLSDSLEGEAKEAAERASHELFNVRRAINSGADKSKVVAATEKAINKLITLRRLMREGE